MEIENNTQAKSEHSPLYGADVYAISISALLRESRNKSIFIVLLLLILLGSLFANYKQFQYMPPTKVVSETADGRIRPIPAMDEPIFTDQQVMNWAAEKFELAYDLPFTKISSHPAKLREFMLPKTASQFWQGLQDAGIIGKVQKGNFVMRGIRSNLPTITASGVQNGRYVWAIEMPMNVIFDGPTRDIEKVIIKAYVGREHLHKSESGLVIGKIEIFPGV